MKKIKIFYFLFAFFMITPTPIVAIASSEEHLNAHRDYQAMKPIFNARTTWNGSVANCNKGSVSSGYQSATQATINYVRSLASLRPITLNPVYNSPAQDAALMMEANNSLSHFPPGSWKCYTGPGATASSKSNLSLGSTGPQSILGYMPDSTAGTNRNTLGHRRWILNAQASAMGHGSTGRASALYVIGPPQDQTEYPEYYGWPSEGYFPWQLYPHGIWSLSASNNDTDMSSATVAVKKNGKSIPVTLAHLPNGYGNPAVSWDVNDPPRYPDPGLPPDQYDVTVSNIKLSGVTQPDYSYSVTMFDAETGPAGSVYRFYNASLGRHLFTSDSYEAHYLRKNLSRSWKFEGLKFITDPIGSCSAQKSVYRFYSEVLKTHLYTISTHEKNTLIGYNDPGVWRYEGVAYCALSSPSGGESPVYRFYSEALKTHLYTIDENEKNTLIGYNDPGVWRYEGVAYYLEKP